MGNLNTDQLKIISTICSVLKICKENKEVMVSGFSGGRCTSSKNLTYEEAHELIKHLRVLSGNQQTAKPTDAMIGKILYYAHEIGWTKKNLAGKIVADVKRVDEWALKYSYLHKKINVYSYSELPKLVTQFQIFYKDYLSKL